MYPGLRAENSPAYNPGWDTSLKIKSYINYKFREDQLLEEVSKYIDDTYSSHYGQDKIQATEVIVDAGHGTGFNIGNIIKYGKRYGKKEGFNRRDLLKIIHYAIIQLYVHDIENKGATT